MNRIGDLVSKALDLKSKKVLFAVAESIQENGKKTTSLLEIRNSYMALFEEDIDITSLINVLRHLTDLELVSVRRMSRGRVYSTTFPPADIKEMLEDDIIA